MRLGLAALGLAVTLSTAANTTEQSSVPPIADRARQLADAVTDVRWGDTLSDWRRDREDEGFCREYRQMTFGDGYSEGLGHVTPLWAVWCRDADREAQRDTVFYTIRDEEPLEARLERIVWRLAVPAAELADLHRGVAANLNKILSNKSETLALPTVGPDNRRIPGRDQIPDESRDAYASGAYRWRTYSNAEIYLYTFQNPPELVIRARTLRLRDAIDRDEPLRVATRLHNPLESQFSAQLQLRGQSLATLLVELARPDADRTRLQPRVRDEIRQLTTAAGAASVDNLAFTLVLLDRLADELWLEEGELPSSVFAQDVLGLLRLETPGQAGRWSYPGTLRWRAWRNHPGSPWGDYAFFQLFLRGFGSDGITDRAKLDEVLKQADEFLRQRPTSPQRVWMLFARALAADTAWSVTQAASYDACAGGSFPARKRADAISAYEAVLPVLADTDPRREYAARQLLRIKIGYDTGTRYFFDCYL